MQLFFGPLAFNNFPLEHGIDGAKFSCAGGDLLVQIVSLLSNGFFCPPAFMNIQYQSSKKAEVKHR